VDSRRKKLFEHAIEALDKDSTFFPVSIDMRGTSVALAEP